MNRIIDKEFREIANSKSIVSFDKTGGGNWEVWNRFISIEGKQAYEIGNICGTCNFYFERLNGANQSVNPKEVAEKLNQGLTNLDREIVNKVSEIIPNGKYDVLLLKCFPKKVELNTKEDYFSNELIQLWGIDGFWGLPHNPKIEYYRGTDQPINTNEKIYEFIIPVFPQNWLEKERVDYYEDMLQNDKTPTAIALSVLDIKAPAIWVDDKEPDIKGHWCLAHYILDGHHKVFTANKLKKPINLLCFLSHEESILENKNDIEKLIREIRKPAENNV